MGYYTNYDVKFDPDIVGVQVPLRTMVTDKKNLLTEAEAGRMVNKDVGMYESLVEYLQFNPFDDTDKWYSHEVDIKAFSLDYPEVLITLEGKGEDNEDMWVKYFKNGLMQHSPAYIIYEPYAEGLLK